MNLTKKELVISIIMLVFFIIMGFNLTVFASNTSQTINVSTDTNNKAVFNLSGDNQTEKDKENNVADVNKNVNKNNNNSSEKLADTGLDDLPWLVIGVCAVSAVFAYKKIKEYNVD